MESLDIISNDETLFTDISDITDGYALESDAVFGNETVSESDSASVVEIEEAVGENESAQTIDTLIDYSDTLSLIYSEMQSINYLITVIVFLQLFIWIENKVKHIVRSESNKWKI